MAELIHAVMTVEGEYGFTLTSPQIPGLVYGRATETEFMAGLVDAIQATGVTGRVTPHRQKRGVTAGGQEFVVRWSVEPHTGPQRFDIAQRLYLDLATDDGPFVAGLVPDQTDTLVFVCCLPSDRLGWIAEQLGEGDSLVISTPVSDAGLTFLLELLPPETGHPGPEELGWTMDTSVAEMMRSGAAGHRPVAVARS